MLISTGVDSLIKLIREKGRIEITLASRLLDIPISTIEEWVHALEQEGILSVEYQLTKIYLKWNYPTSEEIEKEREELEDEKSKLLEELKKDEERSQIQLKEMDAVKNEFTVGYSKIIEQINELSKKTSEMSKSKETVEQEYCKLNEEIIENKKRIDELTESTALMRKQIEKTQKELLSSDIEKQIKNVMESKTKVLSLKQELETMEASVSDTLNLLADKRIDSSDLKKSAHSLYKEFDSLKKQMDEKLGIMKEGLEASKSLLESKEQIKVVNESIKLLLNEMENAQGSVSEIEAKVSSVAAKIKENEKKAERIIEEAKKAEQILKQIKVDSKLQTTINDLINEEKRLEEKMEDLRERVDQALPTLENVDDLILSLAELRKKIAAERKRLAEESGAIFASLDEEASNYTLFQKIKEKALAALTNYSKELEKVEAEDEKAKKHIEKMAEKIDAVLSKFRESVEYVNIEKLSSAVDSIIAKKDLLEKIKLEVDALDSAVTKTSKQIKLLIKEAELTDLRATTLIPKAHEKIKQTREEIKSDIALTRAEQKDFDKKREELRKLIKKLWEQEE